jgi:hypothetical protein
MDNQTKHMLLMAAKGAGYAVVWNEELKFTAGFYIENHDSGTLKIWNPLENDGDALRLAVKVQLSVHNDHKNSNSVWCTLSINEDLISETNGKYESEDEICEEDYAATRLAITRAAAAIGEAMQ